MSSNLNLSKCTYPYFNLLDKTFEPNLRVEILNTRFSISLAYNYYKKNLNFRVFGSIHWKIYSKLKNHLISESYHQNKLNKNSLSNVDYLLKKKKKNKYELNKQYYYLRWISEFLILLSMFTKYDRHHHKLGPSQLLAGDGSGVGVGAVVVGANVVEFGVVVGATVVVVVVVGFCVDVVDGVEVVVVELDVVELDVVELDVVGGTNVVLEVTAMGVESVVLLTDVVITAIEWRILTGGKVDIWLDVILRLLVDDRGGGRDARDGQQDDHGGFQQDHFVRRMMKMRQIWVCGGIVRPWKSQNGGGEGGTVEEKKIVRSAGP
ncbi:hypothetical protein AGLY_007054 [Aphis glycines]|uniref:Uncharacterized protein n=1 Tax=Aphis glycines TaxID=307491 RepID=A0A6G0TQ30_APHGL|nr:hypothetical protein AGLY_007054 [Aphis glycines]